jgi:hypothetical protein
VGSMLAKAPRQLVLCVSILTGVTARFFLNRPHCAVRSVGEMIHRQLLFSFADPGLVHDSCSPAGENSGRDVAGVGLRLYEF